jgi:hypothetical protein
MAHDYTPRVFFRQTPNTLLEVYFRRRAAASGADWEALRAAAPDPALGPWQALAKVDWSTLAVKDVEPVHTAWQGLPKSEREESESDFRAIYDMADGDGVRVIIEEGHFHKKDLGPELDAIEGHHAKVMHVFLNHPRIFRVARQMDHADHMDRRYRRKRNDLPKNQPDITLPARAALEQSLEAYYWQKEGRGQNCHVDLYLRANRYHYFFAYPEDYAGTFIGYDSTGKFVRRAQQPAFDVVFVFDPIDGTLELFARGDKKLKQDLQELFGRTILHEEIGPEKRNSNPYDLSGLKRRDFTFTPQAGDGLTAVRVKNLRLRIKGNSRRRITVEGDIRSNPLDVYDVMKDTLDEKKLPITNVDVDHASLEAEFAVLNGRPVRVPFGISENSCNLKDAPEHLIIKECLKRSGIIRA